MGSLLFEGRAPRLWLRLEQHADRLYYARVPSDLADGFIINANLVESAPEACASFLDKLGKPFVLDPVSYRFERPAWHTRAKDGEVSNKRNYMRLWQKYAIGTTGFTGDPLLDRGVAGAASEEALMRFCQNVIEFQELRLRHAWVEDGARYVGMDRLFGLQLAPSAYLAPYLVIGQQSAAADISASALLASITASLARPRPVIAVLPVLPGVLADFGSIHALAAAIGRSGVQSALVWTVGLSALQLADTPELFAGLVLLVRGLRDADIEVGLLYGGFFSALLRGFGASGFSHALMYGETRALDPSGGLPRTAFYFPPLRQFLPYAVAAELIDGTSAPEYLDVVCGCEICRALVGAEIRNAAAYFQTHAPEGSKRPLPTQEALDLNRFHYLFARRDELELARSRSEPALIADLLRAADRYPPKVTRTLRAWAVRLRAA